MKIVIKIDNISKAYRLGVIGHGTLYKELQSWWARFRDKKDPNSKIMAHSGPGIDGERFWALRDLSLEVKQGEVLGVIGKNGAGKSTLLKILSRVTSPTGGEVKIKGRVASLLEVGTGFHSELTGRENVYLNGTILGMSKSEIDGKFDEIVAFADIEKFIDTPIKRYSSGMTVRLAFSVAAHLDPEILIIDEVLAVGDAEFQKRCLGKMEDVAKGGRTVLFVSHNMASVQQLCSRCILLVNGSLEKMGDTKDTVEYYLTDSYEQEKKLKQNISDRTRRGLFGSQVKVSDCRIYDSSNKENYSLQFGEPFTIIMECIGISDVNNAAFVLGIDSSVTGRIATSISDENDFSFSVKNGQRVCAKLKVDNLILNPGQYFLTTAIRGGISGLDHLPNALSFEITSLLHDENMIPTVNAGLVYIAPKWEQI